MADGLDRVQAPDPARPRRRDPAGKDALYTVAPTAPPPSFVYVSCPTCGVDRGLGVVELARLLRPPVLVNPVKVGRVWSRCPSCGARGWLQVRRGQASLGPWRRPPA